MPRQIDILVYRNTVSVLFREGDFVITTPRNVSGIVEVETRATRKKLEKALEDARHNSKLLKGRNVFYGIFSYESRISVTRRGGVNVFRELLCSNFIVNHLALNSNVFVKRWPLINGANKRGEKHFYSVYRFKKPVAPTYFISNLINSVAGDKSV